MTARAAPHNALAEFQQFRPDCPTLMRQSKEGIQGPALSFSGGIDMSTSSLTTLAVTRDIRTPNKADIGKAVAKDTAAAGADAAEKPPTVPDLLVTLLPTGIVAAYSGVITVVVGLLPDATAAEPNPPEHLGPRFILLLLMICFVAGWTWRDYKEKSRKAKSSASRTPWTEISGASVVAAGWGLATPGSPLADLVNSGFSEVFWPLLAGFAALGLAGVISVNLRTKA